VITMVAFMHFGIIGAIIFLGIVILIQQLEGNVVVPLVMTRTLGVNPVIIFISMILGWLIMGIVGVLLAVPISVIITMMLERTFEE
jgi:predicted PurR-regulated permease PerM